jgi:hypothetical protein
MERGWNVSTGGKNVSIKVEEDAIFLDTGIFLVPLGGKDKVGFEQDDTGRILVHVKIGQRVYVNHRLYHNPTDLQVKMELTE